MVRFRIGRLRVRLALPDHRSGNRGPPHRIRPRGTDAVDDGGDASGDSPHARADARRLPGRNGGHATTPADYLARALFEERDLQVFKTLSFLSDNAKDLRRRLIEKWREYLKQNALPENAALGLWWELAALPADGFEEKAAGVIAKWKGLPDGVAGGQSNPRVKASFAGDAPKIKPDIARIYGKLLADAHDEWLKAGGNEEAFGKLPEGCCWPCSIRGAVDYRYSGVKFSLRKAFAWELSECSKHLTLVVPDNFT